MTVVSRRVAISALGIGAVLPAIQASDASAVDSSATTSASEIPGLRMGYADGPYGQIHYRSVRPKASRNLPVMCFHTSPISSVVYDKFLLELGSDRWAIAVDTPGYGGSAPPPQPANWLHTRPTVQIKDYAKAMIALMDQLGIKKINLFGHHTGSSNATEVARTIPDRVQRVVLVSAPVFTPEEVENFYKTWFNPPEPLSYPDYLREHLRLWDSRRVALKEVSDERFVDFVIEWQRSYPRERWSGTAVMVYAAEIARNISELPQPILLLNPLNDDIPVQTKRAAKLPQNPRSRYQELPGWGFGCLDGHAAELTNLVRQFLTDKT